MKNRLSPFLLLILLFITAVPAGSQTGTSALAPGYGKLSYPLPAAGSYPLPPLGHAADGEVLDTDGKPRRLYELYGRGYVLLAFIYSTCGDVNGCPLTSHVFYQIKAAMKHDSEIANNLRLISLSFDPETDTPEVMALYGNNFQYAGNQGEWRFVTTASEQKLGPILDAYNQGIQREYTADGRYSGAYSHLLRVFLIDPDKKIRNIYSAAFLHQALILNDFKTLLGESRSNILKVAASQPTALPPGPGDNKSGYDSDDYTTDSRALELRRGKQANLLEIVEKPPLGLPAVPGTEGIDQAKIQLGRKLFFDRRLSLNDTFSCAMCHVPDQGFTSNELAMAVGIEGRSVRRNSPTLYNIAYAELLFHDGREDRLERQIWGPLLARNEMGNPSVGYVINKIRRIYDYDGLFEAAFDGAGVSMTTLGSALAHYQRTLVSADSAFDRWYFGDVSDALSDSARRGFELFRGKAGCIACHNVGQDSALFMDNRLHNTGLGYRESMGIRAEKQLVQVAPGVVLEVDRAIIDRVGEPAPADVGLYEVTQNPYDRWKYKTPGLRNVALTAPYMHNGSMSTLRDVVDFYDAGGIPNEGLSPLIKALGLGEREKQDLVRFLESLTGSNVDSLVADAFAAPIGDIKKGDPSWVHGSNVELR